MSGRESGDGAPVSKCGSPPSRSHFPAPALHAPSVRSCPVLPNLTPQSRLLEVPRALCAEHKPRSHAWDVGCAPTLPPPLWLPCPKAARTAWARGGPGCGWGSRDPAPSPEPYSGLRRRCRAHSPSLRQSAASTRASTATTLASMALQEGARAADGQRPGEERVRRVKSESAAAAGASRVL